ncbi:Rieske 2Fe-2S domain-containing protein [Patescibacteria group bacterium]|uniref:Rieske 2Fe-2S domain-containing protein n=1 Tax=candidate division WWE3 bacterium TaxID=2053526 RepID=A0A928Y5X1_UNCKA|nr:Rieske 2Fe-2S domain-containing protein [candidate division WWE3 bacterium]MCL4732421.1 Rieske 2Fe-2S domain-containing protein [Patescibacteria group bacterium]MDL1952672.1 Rieske 2Fe-2S domain-containing protein [Candidatus Uhrbacteria bacterium UHB]RIL01196.1 MAG: hypothetical protein DCC77_01505 [Candidatus Uhrbacteria bacterium]
MNILRKKILIATLSELPEGASKSFAFGGSAGIAYNHRGKIVAFLNRCTHMGGAVELKHEVGNGELGGRSRVLSCRWHGAEFDAESGQRLCGEAPEGSALKPIEIEQDGERLFAILEIVDEFG